MSQTLQKTFEEIEPLIIQAGCEMLRHVGKKFTFDDNRRRIYREVYYCINQTSETLSNRKGLFVVGGVGTGKTIMMKIYKQILRDAEGSPHIPEMVDSNTLIREFLIKGFDVIEKYSRRHYYAKNRKPRGLCIDDLGMEDQKVKSYGNEANVIADILFSRYNEMIETGMRTFATSNVSPVKIGELYGARIADRMIEMFNVIQFTGDSLRR